MRRLWRRMRWVGIIRIVSWVVFLKGQASGWEPAFLFGIFRVRVLLVGNVFEEFG